MFDKAHTVLPVSIYGFCKFVLLCDLFWKFSIFSSNAAGFISDWMIPYNGIGFILVRCCVSFDKLSNVFFFLRYYITSIYQVVDVDILHTWSLFAQIKLLHQSSVGLHYWLWVTALSSRFSVFTKIIRVVAILNV